MESEPPAQERARECCQQVEDPLLPMKRPRDLERVLAQGEPSLGLRVRPTYPVPATNTLGATVAPVFSLISSASVCR